MRKNSIALLSYFDSAAVAAAPVSGRQTVPIDTLLSFFLEPYQKLTRPREKNTAENIAMKVKGVKTVKNQIVVRP